LSTDRRVRPLLATGFVAVVLVAGCGFDDDPDEASGPRTISTDEIAAADKGTPERAALEWWREVQFQNAAGAAERYSPEAKVKTADLNRQVAVAQSSFVGVPEVVDVSRDGDLATVYLTIAPPGSDAPPRNLSLNLVESDGEWLLRDNLLMEQAVARVARAQAAADSD
jgi:hypothetical protein